MAKIIQSLSINQQAMLGTAFAVLAAIGFSAKAILVKLAYVDHVDAITLLTLRMAFSAPVFLAIACGAGGKTIAPLWSRKIGWLRQPLRARSALVAIYTVELRQAIRGVRSTGGARRVCRF